MICKHVYAFLLLLLFFCANGQDQYVLPEKEEFPFSPRFWTTSDGLPQNSINVILQDHQNYIWCFTNEGATKFDGLEFKIFNNNNTEGLLANRMEDAVMGKNGVIWVASSDGFLIKIENDKFESYSLPKNYEYAGGIQIDRQDRPMIIFKERICRFEHGKFNEVIDESILKGVRLKRFVYNLKSKLFYINTAKGIYTFNGDTLEKILPGIIDDRIHFMESLREDSILFSYDGNYYLMKGKEIVDSFLVDENTVPMNLCAFIDTKGNKWITSTEGLLFYKAGRKDPILLTENDGISSNSIKEIFEDVHGNIWLGSTDHGLSLLTPKLFNKLILPTTFKSRSVNGLCPQNDSLLWVALNCMGVLRINSADKRVLHLDRKEKAGIHEDEISLGSRCAWTIYNDKYNNLWIGGFGGGINRFHPDGSTSQYTPEDHAVSATNLAFHQLNEEQLLIGCNTGVYSYNYTTDTFSSFADSLNFPHIPVNHIYKDSKGRIWLCSTRGIVRIENEKLTHFTKQSGDLTIDNFRYIYEDVDQNLWFGSYGDGMFFFENDSFYRTDITKSSLSNVVSWIREYDGKIWVTTNNGLFAADHQQLIESVRNKDVTLDVLSFGEMDGLENDEFNGGFQNTGFIKNDQFYLPSVRDVVIFEPQQIPNLDPSPIEFSKIEMDGIPLDVNKDTSLSYDHKRIHFRISTPIFNNRQNYKLEYKLDGFDNEWNALEKNKQQIEFTKLSAGSYILRVRSRSLINGKIVESGFPFEIASPFWLRPGFYFWVGAGILSLVVLGFRVTSQRRKKKEKELERQVKKRTHELLLSKSNISAIIENTDDLVWSVDTEGHVIYANHNFIQFYKDNTGKKLKQGDNIFHYLDPVNQLYWQRIFKRALKGNKFSVERQLHDNPGHEKFAISHISLNPIKSDGGEVSGVVVYTTDITKALQQQKELELAKQEALSAARSKSEFLATMSHEIRTPMNGVIGMTSLLLKTKLTVEQLDYVRTIRVSGDTLMTVINDILDFSKIDSGQMEVESQPFRVERVVNETFDLLAKDSLDKGLDLLYRIEDSVPEYINGDITRVRQILLNLVNNAIKFTNEGNVKVELSSESNEKGNYLKFSVIDTGIGIDEQKLEKVFKPFSQGDSSTTRKYGGTGLGLAICRKLVQLMEGEIKAISNPGSGSTFIFTIKYDQQFDAKPGEYEGLKKLKGKNIYIHALKGEVGQYICREFEMKGITCRNVEKGSNILEILHGGELPDLLLADYKSLSITTIQEIRKVYPENELPIAILVRHDLKKHKEINLPSVYLVQKPVKYPELYDILNDLSGKVEREDHADTAHEENLALADDYPMNILVVEDGAVNQKIALLFLEKLGYVADVAANGKEALEAVNRQNYDLVFMDVQMPVMDGYEATRKIRELYGKDKPVIIAMTANAMESDREVALETGMDDYIAKPVQLNSFRKMVLKWGIIAKAQ